MPVHFSLPPRDNIKKWTCPHCGRKFDAYRINKHLPACPKLPATLERLAKVLPDPANPEVIIAYEHYRQLRRDGQDLPSETIMGSTWGNWAEVAHTFGLITWDEFEQRQGDGSLLPATVAELQRLSMELYGGAAGPNFSDYIELADPTTGAQLAKTAIKKYDNWEGVLAAAGLKLESMSYYWQARKLRRDQGKAKPDPEIALNAPLGPDEHLSALPIPERPIPVIAAHTLPDGKGTFYRLGKLPDDIAPRVYGHVIAAIVDTPREVRYLLK